MKKIIASLIVLIMTVGLAVGCSSSNIEPKKETETKTEETKVEETIEVEEVEEIEEEVVEEEKKAKLGTETVSLTVGKHIVGKHIDSGFYDVTFDGTGNFVIRDNSDSLMTNVVVGREVSTYRAILSDGYEIDLKSTGATFTPAPLVQYDEYKEYELHSGYWIVGLDIGEGRYTVQALNDTRGNFVIVGVNGRLKANEILGKEGSEIITVDLEENDIIKTSHIDSLFIPTN